MLITRWCRVPGATFRTIETIETSYKSHAPVFTRSSSSSDAQLHNFHSKHFVKCEINGMGHLSSHKNMECLCCQGRTCFGAHWHYLNMCNEE